MAEKEKIEQAMAAIIEAIDAEPSNEKNEELEEAIMALDKYLQ